MPSTGPHKIFWYNILHIDVDATEDEIRKTYRRLTLLSHPDKVDEAHRDEATT